MLIKILSHPGHGNHKSLNDSPVAPIQALKIPTDEYQQVSPSPFFQQFCLRCQTERGRLCFKILQQSLLTTGQDCRQASPAPSSS